MLQDLTPAVVVAMMLGVAAPAGAADLPALLLGMEAAYARVADYTARFSRQEWIGGQLRPPEEALLKFQRPGRVYLRWTAGPPKGREILYVPGRDADRILVHQPGALSGFFTLVMAADSPRVLRESRHPVTDVGIGRLVELIVANVKRGLERGELTLVNHGVGQEAGRRVRRIEGVWPRDRAKGYYSYRAIAVIDAEWGLPVEVAIFDWDDRMVADYAYRDLRLNPGLSASDFDPANPDYSFPRWRLPL